MLSIIMLWSRAGVNTVIVTVFPLLAAADHQEYLHRHAKCRQELDGCG